MSSEMHGPRQLRKAEPVLPQSGDGHLQQNSDCEHGTHLFDVDSARHRLQVLYDEIHAIHLLDRRYWQVGEEAVSPERVSYQLRQERLEEIRSELARLKVNRP